MPAGERRAVVQLACTSSSAPFVCECLRGEAVCASVGDGGVLPHVPVVGLHLRRDSAAGDARGEAAGARGKKGGADLDSLGSFKRNKQPVKT